jgi:hypothetical protein
MHSAGLRNFTPHVMFCVACHVPGDSQACCVNQLNHAKVTGGAAGRWPWLRCTPVQAFAGSQGDMGCAMCCSWSITGHYVICVHTDGHVLIGVQLLLNVMGCAAAVCMPGP